MDIEPDLFETYKIQQRAELDEWIQNKQRRLESYLFYSELAIDGLRRVVADTPLHRLSVLSVTDTFETFRQFEPEAAAPITKGLIVKSVAHISSRKVFVDNPRPYDEATKAAGRIIDSMISQGYLLADGSYALSENTKKWGIKTRINLSSSGRRMLNEKLKPE